MAKNEQYIHDELENESWQTNPTIMVSSSNKIQRDVNLCESLTDIGENLLENILPLNNIRYQIIDDIAEGGGGIVYEYFDTNTSRRIAMKALHSEADSSKEKLAFIKEALVTANLEHPSIVPIHEIALDDQGRPMYSMKKLNGKPLTKILTGVIRKDPEIKQNYGLPQLLQIFLKVCEATSYAHSQNILHLDIKPENIMIGEFGDVLLMDWGLAEHIGTDYCDEDLESIFESFIDNKYENHIHGTPGYMAPEQILGGPAEFDERTDIHGLGALLYSILTCRRPFPGKNQMDIINNTIEGNLPTPKKFAPLRTIPTELSAIAMKAMSTKKENRYQSVKELHSDINNFLLGHAVTAVKDTMAKKVRRFYLKRKAAVNLISVTLLFASLLGGFLYNYHIKTHGSWATRLDVDFSKINDYKDKLFLQSSADKNMFKISENMVDKEGLTLSNNWLLVGQPNQMVDYTGNVKIELDFEWSDWNDIDAIEVCFNSAINKKTPSFSVPAGYSVQLASWRRQFSYISINRKPGEANYQNAMQFNMPKKLRNNLIIERIGKEINVYMNHQRIMTQSDPSYFSGRPFGKIRIRSWDSRAKIKHLTISSKKRAQLASPLDLGNSYVEHNQLEIALYEYMKVIHDFTSEHLRDNAGKRYINSVYTLQSRGDITDKELTNKIEELHKTYWSPELEFYHTSQETIRAWNKKEYSRALTIIESQAERASKKYLTSLILREKHRPLPEKEGIRLLHLIALNTELKSLDISNYQLTDISPLKEMKLSILHCSDNMITDISPLKNVPIESINLRRNDIGNLSALENHRLRWLLISKYPLTSPPVFKHKTLEVFFAGATSLNSIDFLKGHPLNALTISYTNVDSLEPLRGCMTLRDLYCQSTKITDLEPLKDIPLHILDIAHSPKTRDELKNIDQLNLSNISRLTIMETKLNKLPDLSSASELTQLQLYHNNLIDISPLSMLKKHGTIEEITLTLNPIIDGSGLEGLALNLLIINGTKIKDAGFLASMQLKLFPKFHTAPLIPDSLQKVYKSWSNNPEMKHYAPFIQALVLAGKNRYREIKDLAITVGDSKYISIQKRMTYEKAKEFAKKCGGHLACFETKKEFYMLMNSPHFKGLPPITYLGLERTADNSIKWLTGVPLNWKLKPFKKLSNPAPGATETHYYTYKNNTFSNAIWDQLPFIIEFDNTEKSK